MTGPDRRRCHRDLAHKAVQPPPPQEFEATLLIRPDQETGVREGVEGVGWGLELPRLRALDPDLDRKVPLDLSQGTGGVRLLTPEQEVRPVNADPQFLAEQRDRGRRSRRKSASSWPGRSPAEPGRRSKKEIRRRGGD